MATLYQTLTGKGSVSTVSTFPQGDDIEKFPARITAANTDHTATRVIEQQGLHNQQVAAVSKKRLITTSLPASARNFCEKHPYIAGVSIVLGGIALGAMLGMVRVLQGSSNGTSAELQTPPFPGNLNPYGSNFDLPPTDLDESVFIGRDLLSVTCPGGPSFASLNGVTGIVASGTSQGRFVVIPSANGNQTVSAWVNPTIRAIQISVNAKNGTQTLPPTTISVAGDGSVGSIVGDSFGNGNIAIAYSSYPTSGTAAMQFVIFSPDGSTNLSKTAPLTISGTTNPQVACGKLSNGNVQGAILGASSAAFVEVDSTGNAVAGTLFTITLPSGATSRPLSFGQYPTGQKLFVLNDSTNGMRAYVINGNAVTFSPTFTVSGQTVASSNQQATVDTNSGPVTFFITSSKNLYMAQVNPATGIATVLPVDTSGAVSSVGASSSYNPNNPSQPGHVSVVINKGGSVSIQVLDGTTLAQVGCSTSAATGGTTYKPYVAFYPDGQSLRTLWQGTNLNLSDLALAQPPTLVSGPNGTQTLYSNTPPTTTYTYPVVGTGTEATIYLETNNPAVSVSGSNIVVTVTPAMVGTTFDVEYAIEDAFGQISSNQTLTVTIPDRIPTLGALPAKLSDATQGAYYAYQFSAITFPPDLDGQAMTPSVVIPPQLTGLTFNPNTLLLSGYPAQTGTFQLNVSNTQTVNGITATGAVPLTVYAPGSGGVTQIDRFGSNRNLNVQAGIPNNETFTSSDFGDPTFAVPFSQLTLTVTSTTGPTPPAGVVLNGHTVTYTAPVGTTGTVTYLVSASYNGGSQSLPIVVANTVYSASAAKPTLVAGSFQPLTAQANNLFQTQIPLSAWYTPINDLTIVNQQVTVTDDGGWLTDVSVSADGTVILQGTPGNSAKNAAVAITAVDSEGQESNPVTQTIQVVGQTKSTGPSSLSRAQTTMSFVLGVGSISYIALSILRVRNVVGIRFREKLEQHKDEFFLVRLAKACGSSLAVLLIPTRQSQALDQYGYTALLGNKKKDRDRSMSTGAASNGRGRTIELDEVEKN